MKVELNPISKNVNELRVGDNLGLFSYKTLVAVYTRNGFYRIDEYYSRTTSKHINQWLGTSEAIEASSTELDSILYSGKD